MAFVAVYDACVLFPGSLRDLLIRLASTRLFRPRCTDAILDEMIAAIVNKTPGIDATRLQRTRDLMVRAMPDCLVRNYEPLIASVELPDPNDRHVLAAAVRAGAQVIVTFNLDDFPETALSKWDIAAQHPDAFVCHLIDLAAEAVVNVIEEQAADLMNPPSTPAELLERLSRVGLTQSTAELRALLAR